jgi:two-component system chemotaxis sensor kinase CheA
MLVDDHPVEFLDSFWIFAQVLDWQPVEQGQPVCLLADDSAWARLVLAPLVESAGYAVAFTGGGSIRPDVTIISEESHAAAVDGKVLRLRRDVDAADAAPDSLWRYDRAALLAELGRCRSRRSNG